MRMKKLVALGLATVLTVSMLSGCGGNKKTNGGTDTTTPDKTTEATATPDGDKTEGPKEEVELTFWNQDGNENMVWDDPIADKITEMTGVKLKQQYPVGDGNDLALMIAQDNYPDLIYAKGGGSQLVEAGALIDMTELIDQYGPNIKKLYGDEFIKLQYSSEDPAIYQFSSMGVNGVSHVSSGTAQMQWAVIKENNYKYPKTIAEYEAMIRDYLTKHPTAEDGNPNIGISISCADWHWYITLANPAGFIANAAPDNGQWIVDDNDGYKVYYKHCMPEQKEYFQWLNKMYHEGILDQEFATQTHEDYIAKIAAGRVIGLLDTSWDYSEGEKVLKADEKFDKTYAPLPVYMKENMKILQSPGLATGWGVGISKNCKDPVAAIKLIDYMCSEEGLILRNWGIEGVNYTVENGKRVRNPQDVIDQVKDPDFGKRTGLGQHGYPFPTAGGLDSKGDVYVPSEDKQVVIDAYNEEEKAACKAWNVELLKDILPTSDKKGFAPYSPLWSSNKPSEFAEIETALNEIAWPAMIQCIKADPAEFDAQWDKLQADLKAAGSERAGEMLTKIVQDQVKVVTGQK